MNMQLVPGSGDGMVRVNTGTAPIRAFTGEVRDTWEKEAAMADRRRCLAWADTAMADILPAAWQALAATTTREW
jgi:fructose/tagatose bisphosphate aldolase